MAINKTLNKMKSITESINEARNSGFPEVQSESSKGAAYSTIDLVGAKKKYKHGFLQYGQYQESVFLVAFNKVEDIQDLLDTDDDEYSALLNMKPQEHKVVDGELFVKLW